MSRLGLLVFAAVVDHATAFAPTAPARPQRLSPQWPANAGRPASAQTAARLHPAAAPLVAGFCVSAGVAACLLNNSTAVDESLDTMLFDPDDTENRGAVVDQLRRLFKKDPEKFEAVYVAVVATVMIWLSQAIVRWYKHNIWDLQSTPLESLLPPLDFLP
ncbi:hypothetical protein M885DRAFT_525880 [Pelagophyceae sp. CCMP2097]|nr:hypothetical protein M885DRAFT_525880 [Pelagophyceae sp. CCMP2097]